MEALAAAAELLRPCRRILVFTGAGISTESGIPDFRGPQGVWATVDPDEFTLDRYLRYPETRRRSWRMRMNSGALDAEPNAAHRAVVALWRAGRMVGCVTQNIDGLHQKAGLPEKTVVELHGNAQTTVCLGCGDRQPTAAVLHRVDAGEEDPGCLLCGGILKTAVVYFGEMMPVGAVEEAFDLAARADAVISVGSTLSVFPAAYVPLQVAERGRPFVILNMGPTDLDHLASARLEAPAGTALPALVAALG
ncbi:MAG: Sir2 family NAD-dependent protein deacetylase [Acidimicrobiia bacterium]|nr:Sir2 family NAD-dependent protein deacetylase [Acidimicrobiia bacterium]